MAHAKADGAESDEGPEDVGISPAGIAEPMYDEVGGDPFKVVGNNWGGRIWSQGGDSR